MEINLQTFSKIISLPCVYCGDIDSKIGIDRVDNSLGYTEENSAPCCSKCNYMKKDMNFKQFIEHVKKIQAFNSIYH